MLRKIFLLFKIAIFFNLLYFIIHKEWFAIFICFLNFILCVVADIIQKKFKYSDFFHLLVYIFLIGSLLFGEVYYFYSKIWFFDVILHVLSSFIVSGLFICIVKFFKYKVDGFMLIVCIFSFAMMIASLWEITEFSIDKIFSTDMQKDTVINEINSIYLSNDGKSVVKRVINNMSMGRYNISGYLDIGLYDTMWDLICAVFGSLLFIVINKVKEAF